MSKYDIQIDTKVLKDTINNISTYKNKIDEISKNIYDAYLSLDSTKWQGDDKTKIDNGYGEYLKKMANFSEDIENTINVLKEGLSRYDISFKQINNEIQDLEEL